MLYPLTHSRKTWSGCSGPPFPMYRAVQSFPWPNGPCCWGGWIWRQVFSPRFAACCEAERFGGSKLRWIPSSDCISFPKIPPVTKAWWQKPSASPGCCPASKETGRRGAQHLPGTPEQLLPAWPLPLLWSKREVGWRLSQQCPHR